MQLTVIVPTFNEVENLPSFLVALFEVPIQGLKALIVDDNSPDGTGKLADQLVGTYPGCLSVIHRPGKMGLGSAYLTGFRHALEAGAGAIAQMDADFSHPPMKLVELLAALDRYDIAMGSRYIPGGNLDEHWPLWRKGLSAFGNFYARTILNMPVRDVTGGFRIWRRETLLGMPLERMRSNGYAFQVELAYIACQLGFRSIEIPFYFADRRWGKSKMSLSIQLEAAVRVWQMLFEYRDLPRLRHI